MTLNILRKLTATHTHVKPLAPGLFADQPVVVVLPVWRSFLDDWRRYGLGVAWYNLRYMLALPPG